MTYHSFFIKLFTFIAFPGILLISGCAASAEYNPSKMDTSLNQKVRGLEKEDPGAMIQFTGKTSGSIDAQMRSELEATGINIETAAGDIFTASGNVESVKKVSLLSFVVYLELAKKLDIK